MGTIILVGVLSFALGAITGAALVLWFFATNWRDIERKVNAT